MSVWITHHFYIPRPCTAYREPKGPGRTVHHCTRAGKMRYGRNLHRHAKPRRGMHQRGLNHSWDGVAGLRCAQGRYCMDMAGLEGGRHLVPVFNDGTKSYEPMTTSASMGASSTQNSLNYTYIT